MSADILAAPHLNVRFKQEVQEDGGEAEENQVEILDEEEHLGSQEARPHAPKNPAVVKTRYFKAAAVTLGGMYLLILAGIIIRYISVTLDNSELSNSLKELNTTYDQLQANYSELSNSLKELNTAYEELNDGPCVTQRNPEGWKRFGCSCYYKSTEMKNWTESRKDCQDSGADLVTLNSKEEKDFLWKLDEHGDSWVGLQSVRKPSSWDFGWEWVDTSKPGYVGWNVKANVNPTEWSAGYIDLQGTLQHANTGSKQWICEKQI